jgi:hypothetical protein
VTGLNELERRRGKVSKTFTKFSRIPDMMRDYTKVLVTSMCIGTGMGAAAVLIGEFYSPFPVE